MAAAGSSRSGRSDLALPVGPGRREVKRRQLGDPCQLGGSVPSKRKRADAASAGGPIAQAAQAATPSAATSSPPVYVSAPSRPESLRYKTPLNSPERDWFDFVIETMSPQVESVETKAEDGSRWLTWPIGMTIEGERPDRARLLMDATGAWHQLTTFEPKPFGAEDKETELQFGQRLSDDQWLETATTDLGVKKTANARHFLKLLASPEGRMPVTLLKDVGRRPLVKLLTSMAERAVSIDDALARALPGIAVTVATLGNLKQAQLFAVIQALQDADGMLSLDLSDRRHLPGKVSGQVMDRLKHDEFKFAARALMAVIQRRSEPLGDTAWGAHYYGKASHTRATVRRYALSNLLIQSFAAKNGNHDDRIGATNAMRVLEDELGHSEPLPWSLIEAVCGLSTTEVEKRFSWRSAAFIKFLKNDMATLRKRHENPPVTQAQKLQLALELRPKSPEIDLLEASRIEPPPGPLRESATACRTRLNIELLRDPGARRSLENQLSAFCMVMDNLAKPWGGTVRHPGEYEPFVAQTFAQHDADLARGDMSRSLHYFLELPREIQKWLAWTWADTDAEGFMALASLDSQYKLGLASHINDAAPALPSLQVHRDMRKAVPMSGSNKGYIANALMHAAEGRRPADESLIIQLTDSTLVTQLAEVRTARQVENNLVVSTRATLLREAREDLVKCFGHYKVLGPVAPDLKKLSKGWYHKPYDPLWSDDPDQDPAPDAPRQPRLASHVELARAVLTRARAQVQRDLAFDEESGGASNDNVDARDAVVEWLNFVESNMHNTSYDVALRLAVAKPSKPEFIARVSADLRASANAVSRLPAPSPPRLPVEPISVRTLTLEEMIGRRAMFVDRMRYLADRLDHDEDGPVRLAFNMLHDIGAPASEPSTDVETDEGGVGNSMYGAMVDNDDERDLLDWVNR